MRQEADQTDLFEHRWRTLSREFEIGHGSHRRDTSEGKVALCVPNFLASRIEPRLLCFGRENLHTMPARVRALALNASRKSSSTYSRASRDQTSHADAGAGQCD